jgi:anthranilate phosphoribosyltransferase
MGIQQNATHKGFIIIGHLPHKNLTADSTDRTLQVVFRSLQERSLTVDTNFRGPSIPTCPAQPHKGNPCHACSARIIFSLAIRSVRRPHSPNHPVADATLFKVSVFSHVKQLLESREPLTRDQSAALMRGILAGELPDLQLAALLGALSARDLYPAELAGFVDSIRAAAIPIPLTPAERESLVDTCGTGADASGTFNISTAAALVAAAAGATVAKHGNRAVTSSCGSADVLEALGIPVTLTPAQAAEALRRHRFAFLLAPALHPALKAVLPVRKGLGVRTVFNLLGPLANPAGARAQVMGVHTAAVVPHVAEAMRLLDVRHAFVVNGTYQAPPEPPSDSAPLATATHSRGMDEFSISGPSHVAEVTLADLTLSTLDPATLGLTLAPIETLRSATAADNAAILRDIFAGHTGPRRDIVLLNAAAVLTAADLTPTLAAGLHLAAQAVDSGAVTRLLTALAQSAC